MLTRFLMNQDLIRSRLYKCGGVSVRIRNHKMNIQLHLSGLAEGLDNWRAQGDIGDKMAVHDVHVDHLAPYGFELSNLITQTREVRCKDRWQNFNHERG